MKFLEKDLETIIYESDKHALSERGLDLPGKLLRQLRVGNYGILDLLHISRDYNGVRDERFLVLNVIEIKKENISIDTFLQALRYARGIGRFLEKRGFYRFVFEITLIGKKIETNNSFVYLTDMVGTDYVTTYGNITSIKFYEYRYDLEGLMFDEKSGYKLRNEGLNNIQNN